MLCPPLKNLWMISIVLTSYSINNLIWPQEINYFENINQKFSEGRSDLIPLYLIVNQLSKNDITIYLSRKYISTNYIFLAYYNQFHRHWLTCAFNFSYMFFFFNTLMVVWQYFSPRVPTKFLTNSIASGDWGCLGFQEIKNSATCTYEAIKISSSML